MAAPVDLWLHPVLPAKKKVTKILPGLRKKYPRLASSVTEQHKLGMSRSSDLSEHEVEEEAWNAFSFSDTSALQSSLRELIARNTFQASSYRLLSLGESCLSNLDDQHPKSTKELAELDKILAVEILTRFKMIETNFRSLYRYVLC